MSDTIIIALITVVGTILGAAIGAFGSIEAAKVKAKGNNDKPNGISCAAVGLAASVMAMGGLLVSVVLGGIFVNMFSGKEQSQQQYVEPPPITAPSISPTEGMQADIVPTQRTPPVQEDATMPSVRVQSTTEPLQSVGIGCYCTSPDCNGTPIQMGEDVPTSAILQPNPGDRGTLYMYLGAGKAEVDGVLWIYIDENGHSARRNCVEAQLQFFQYDILRTIE